MRRGLLDELKTHCFAHFACSFSNRKNRRKDGGIYSLSILQAEASGIHDGRWFGGGRCRCCQDARHRLQGRFGTCFSILVSCCHSTKILPPHVQPPGGQVEITPYFLETRMQSGRRPFDDIIDRYWTGYLGEFCDASAWTVVIFLHLFLARQNCALIHTRAVKWK